MIFSELYSAYYNAVANIIKTAISHPVKKEELRKIIEENAFGESVLNIEPAFTEERWQVLFSDGMTNIENDPVMPFTNAQKRWLKAISLDPRIRLFCDDTFDLPDVEPLFTPDDYVVFDKYSDGDDFEDEGYRERFRLILEAIKEEQTLKISMDDRRGRRLSRIIIPKYLEYSEKDDKFRLFALGKPNGGTFNLGRIIKCEKYTENIEIEKMKETHHEKCSVVFELYDYRKALERVLLHFAHFEKEVVKESEKKYRVTVVYEKEDETELVIRILSFGPMIKVIEPDDFVNLIKKRLIDQKGCGL